MLSVPSYEVEVWSAREHAASFKRAKKQALGPANSNSALSKALRVYRRASRSSNLQS